MRGRCRILVLRGGHAISVQANKRSKELGTEMEASVATNQPKKQESALAALRFHPQRKDSAKGPELMCSFGTPSCLKLPLSGCAFCFEFRCAHSFILQTNTIFHHRLCHVLVFFYSWCLFLLVYLSGRAHFQNRWNSCSEPGCEHNCRNRLQFAKLLNSVQAMSRKTNQPKPSTRIQFSINRSLNSCLTNQSLHQSRRRISQSPLQT